MDMFASNLRRERAMGNLPRTDRMDLARFPQSNANVKDRLKIEEGNLNLESFQFLRGEQVKTDVFMAGQASSSLGESPYRAAQSGQR